MYWSDRSLRQWIFDIYAAEADHKYAHIDSTIVRARQHSAGVKKVIAATKVSVAPVKF